MKKRVQFFAIDAIRLLLALIVLVNHWAQFGRDGGVTMDKSLAEFPAIHAFAGVGAIGVQTFFIISGFVIAMSASGIDRPTSPRRFLTMRAIRLLPALWISVGTTFVARTMSGDPIPSMAIAAIRSSVLSPIGPYIDGVVWSLVVEAVFYVLVATMVLSGPRWTLDRLALWLGGISTVYIITLLLFTVFPDLSFSEQILPLLLRFPFKVLLLRHGVFFGIGMLLWSLKNDGLARHKLAIMLVFIFAGLIEVMLSVERTLIFRLAGAMLWGISVAMLLAGVAFSGYLERKLHSCRRIMQFAGGISYPIYLNHYALGMALLAFEFEYNLPISPGLMIFTGVFATSLAVFVAERRIQRKLKQLLLG